MKLLKYPLGLPDKTANASVLGSIGSLLLVADSTAHVSVWQQQELAEAAYDNSKIKALGPKLSFDVDMPQGISFIEGTADTLYLGCNSKVICIKSWFNQKTSSTKIVYTVSSEVITDMKLCAKSNALFITTTNKNKVLLFNMTTLQCSATIELSCTPLTCTVNPMGDTIFIYMADRSVLEYQYSLEGAYKQVNKIPQCTQLQHMPYKITMPPQADYLPILHSLKGQIPLSSQDSTPNTKELTESISKSTPTHTNDTSTNSFSSLPSQGKIIALLDRNNNYKVSSVLVTPSSETCTVLKYSPQLYEKNNGKSGTKQRYNLLSTTGLDSGSVIVWNTNRIRPLFNAVQVSNTPINDMLWSQDGYTLFAISNDNVLYNFAFQKVDLGNTLAASEIEQLQKKNKQLAPLPDPSSLSLLDLEDSSKNKHTNTADIASKITGKKPTKKKNATLNGNVVQGTTLDFKEPSYTVPRDLKRKQKDSSENGTPLIPKKPKKELEPIDFLDTGLLLPNSSFSRIRLATPKTRLKFQLSSPSNNRLVLDVRNNSGNEQMPTVVTLTSSLMEQEKTLFKDYIPKFITMATCGRDVWACCSEDGTLYTYNDSGKRILPPLVLGVPCSFLEACENFLLCLTSLGDLYCWDLNEKRVYFPPTSVFPLLNPALRYSDDILTRAENITMCSVTKNGVPLVTLSNGDGYMFDKMMEVWLLVSDSWWAYGSQYWNMLNDSSFLGDDTSNKAKEFASTHQLMTSITRNNESIVNYMEKKTNDELTRKGRIKNLQRFARTILIKEGYESLEEAVTLSHLENKILVSMRLEEADEFESLLRVYCIRLGELGYTERFDDVLQWLYNGGEYENSVLVGKNRKELLKNVLIACANIRHVQRVMANYVDILNVTES